MKPFEFVPFKESDIAILTSVMKRAFDADAQFHLGHDGGPPGYDDGSFLRQWALHPKAAAFRLNSGSQPAGAVILWIDRQTWVNMLGCIFLDPVFQHSGMGTAIWQKIENPLSLEESSYQMRKPVNHPKRQDSDSEGR